MRTHTNQEMIEQLNDLIQLDFDAVQLYAKALEHVDDSAAKEDLRTFMTDHQRHVANLSSMIEELGGEPRTPSPDIKGVLLEVVTAFRSVTGTKGALKAMKLNERFTNKVYDTASKLEMPERAASMIEAHRRDERRHLSAIEGHLARLSKPDRRTGVAVPVEESVEGTPDMTDEQPMVVVFTEEVVVTDDDEEEIVITSVEPLRPQ
jgi:uncharacterized protein (TIGR02284 family)